jgi:hypothetical protein
MESLRIMGRSVVSALRHKAQETASTARKQAQLVLEIVNQGPLEGKSGQWDREKRDRAEQEVQEALARWRSMSQPHEREKLER